jgi:predicted metal-dependent peptidase
MKRELTEDEFQAIAVSLEDYHAVFYRFWLLGSIWFDDSIPTACVRLPKNEGDKVEMRINPDFWAKHDHRGKLFIVCHECMHILLDHGIRNGKDVKGATPILVNKAQDITINEMIVDLFNFPRVDLQNWQNYCWIDTCFKHSALIQRNQSFTYYLQKLIQYGDEPPPGSGAGPTGGSIFDEHEDDEEPTEAGKEAKESLAGKLAEELSADELDKLQGALPMSSEAGKMRGSYKMQINRMARPVKLNVKKLVSHLKRSRHKMQEFDVESFIKDDRRFNAVTIRRDVAIPGKHEGLKPKKGKLLTAMFMDVSGSCMDYFKNFEAIWKAFDLEKDTFDLRSFAFDTSVMEIKPGVRLRVAGGTAFGIIEEKCQELSKEYNRYPDCVIVVTDGQGTNVAPSAPKRWVWMITNTSYSLKYIPKGSRHYFLKDVTTE